MTGLEAVLDHPRRDLEEFFIDVINTARQEQAPDSVAAREQAIAPYLREEPKPADHVLNKLQQAPAPEKAADPTPPAPEPEPAPTVNKAMLQQANQKLETLLKDRGAGSTDS